MRWPGAATHLANRQGVAMAVPSWRSMGAHGLSVSFTVDGRCKAFAVSALMLFEAQRPGSAAGHERSEWTVRWNHLLDCRSFPNYGDNERTQLVCQVLFIVPNHVVVLSRVEMHIA